MRTLPRPRTAIAVLGAWLGLLIAGGVIGLLLRHGDPGWDLSGLRGLHGAAHTTLTRIVRTIRVLGEAPVLDVVFVVAAAGLLVARRGRELVFLLLASPGAALLIVLIKTIVNRPRPPVVHLVVFTGSSWPSADAGDSLALYGALALLAVRLSDRPAVRRAAVLVAGALCAAVGIERVYLGAHYPTDVLGAWLIVGAWLACLWGVLRRRPTGRM